MKTTRIRNSGRTALCDLRTREARWLDTQAKKTRPNNIRAEIKPATGDVDASINITTRD